MIKNLLIVTIIVILSITVYSGYQLYKNSRLQTVRITRGEIISSVFASGKTKADKEAHLAFASTGKIVYLPFAKNHEVKKWQVVATIDTSDLKANIDKELQDYLKTRWDLDQAQKDTYKDQIQTDTIKRAKEKAQFDLNKSITDVEIADRAMKNASLYSPFDGIVTEVGGEINEWVSVFSTKPLITIIDPQTVYFQAELEEENIGKVAVGQEATVILDAYPDKKFAGNVAEIDKKAIVKDNGDTVLPVKIVLSLDEILPLVGLNGDTQFIFERKKNILILPKRAIRKVDNRSVVTVKKNMALKNTLIETGVSDAKNIEVIGGVTESDQIVLPSELE